MNNFYGESFTLHPTTQCLKLKTIVNNISNTSNMSRQEGFYGHRVICGIRAEFKIAFSNDLDEATNTCTESRLAVV